ncbi:unnamed protein product [Sphagnum balticum]
MGRPQRYRGVRQRHWGSWVSEIRHPLLKTRVWLGTFETAEDAAHAYDETARLICGSHARTNFPLQDPPKHAASAHNTSSPKSQSSMLSATLSAKLHRWYLESQQQEHQAHEVLQLLHHDIDHAKHINDTRMEQSTALTCLCLDAQQSNQLGILQKQTGRQSADEANSWLQRKVEFATMSCNISPRPPALAHEEDYCALEAAASTEISYMNAAEEDKFASEMIEELLGHNCACGARIHELVISSPSNSLSHDSISTTNNNNNSCKCS